MDNPFKRFYGFPRSPEAHDIMVYSQRLQQGVPLDIPAVVSEPVLDSAYNPT